MRAILVIIAALQMSSFVRAGDQQWIHVSATKNGFEFVESQAPFVVWGFNFDRLDDGRLLEDFWHEEWNRVESAFADMKALGANVVRIHLQYAKFMESETAVRPQAISQLTRLVALAEKHGLYLDLTGLGCYHKQDVPDWYDDLSEEARWKTQAVFWREVAKTCAKSPAIFCYNLMNEPVVPGGKLDQEHWLGGAFAGKHFVQFVTRTPRGRTRPEIAVAWIRVLTAAIREVDQRHLITVGLVDWSLDRPGLTSGFVPEKIAPEVDFIAVHLYPEKGKVREAIDVLKAFAAVGKPVIIEEAFPLTCSTQELEEFIHSSQPFAAGWVSFYWGVTAAEYRERPGDEAVPKLIADWLDRFQKIMQTSQKTPE